MPIDQAEEDGDADAVMKICQYHYEPSKPTLQINYITTKRNYYYTIVC